MTYSRMMMERMTRQMKMQIWGLGQQMTTMMMQLISYFGQGP